MPGKVVKVPKEHSAECSLEVVNEPDAEGAHLGRPDRPRP
jgi:hypothetical protein